MSSHDEEFFRRLRAMFSVEAEEHLGSISSGLLELEKGGEAARTAAVLERIHRAAHSLKGASRAVDLRDIEQFCQVLESIFSAWKKDVLVPSVEHFDQLHHALDLMHTLIALTGPLTPELIARRDTELRTLRAVEAGAPPAFASPVPAGFGEPQPEADSPGDKVTSTPAAASTLQPAPAAPSQPAVAGTGAGSPPEEPHVVETVRIASAKLERQVLEAEELLPLKSVFAQYGARLRELQELLALWNKRWGQASGEARWLREAAAAQGGSAAAALAEFLDTNQDLLRGVTQRVRSLGTDMERDRVGAARLIDTLLEDSKRLLMLPFSVLSDAFPRIIRDICRDQRKEAELTILGGEVELDKRILDGMKDAFIHILRNCMDHGIEPPDRRAALGKVPCGSITISVAQIAGNKVEIVIADDGGGIDTRQVYEAAARRGVVRPGAFAELQEQALLDLVFHSGVSTRAMITELSGLGLGMSIVRQQTERLGGRVSLASMPGAGTRLRIELPVALATFRGVLVRLGEATFVVPRTAVLRVLRFPREDVRTVQNRETLALDGRAVALVRLEAVLGVASARPRGDLTHGEAILLATSQGTIAFTVDEVLHEEDVLVKPLRRPIVRARNIAGASVLATGQAALVLNVEDLVKSAAAAAAQGPQAAQPVSAAEAPAGEARRVLVVEDSITSRMLIKGILESAGHTVRTAVDGVEAFTALREDEFDLVVSDVEMPRMNGFDLTGQIRADRRLAHLPVILVTALEKREERERGIDAGANAYVLKSSFDQSNLLEIIRRLV